MGRRQGPGHVPFGDYISSLGVCSARVVLCVVVCSARDVDNIPPRDRTYQTPVSPTFSPLKFDPPIRRFTRKIRHFVTGFNSPPDDDAAEGSTGHVSLGRPTEADDDVQSSPTQREEPHVSGAQRKKLTREKKRRRGQNKGRQFQKVRDELDLCWKVAAGETCEFGSEYV